MKIRKQVISSFGMVLNCKVVSSSFEPKALLNLYFNWATTAGRLPLPLEIFPLFDETADVFAVTTLPRDCIYP